MKLFAIIFEPIKYVPIFRCIVNRIGFSPKFRKKLKYIVTPSMHHSSKENLEFIRQKLIEIDYKQNLVMDYFLDPCVAKSGTGAFRKHQLKCVELLKFFIEAVEASGFDLSYWVDGGSLLGAVRHKGLIPWDDDIDVSLLLDDYRKIVKYISEHSNGEYYIEEQFDRNFVKLKKRGSCAHLDIFGYEDNSDRIRMATVFPEYEILYRSIPKKVMFPLGKKSFEGIDVSVPADVDSFLRLRFGDYEKLPKKPNPYVHLVDNEKIVFYPDEKI